MHSSAPGDAAQLGRAARLSAALYGRADHPADVSPEVDAFIDASNRASQAELAAARAQADHEAHGRRRLRRVAIALAAVVALALAGGGIALVERGTARAQAHRAQLAALSADVSRLAALATSLPGDQVCATNLVPNTIKCRLQIVLWNHVPPSNFLNFSRQRARVGPILATGMDSFSPISA